MHTNTHVCMLILYKCRLDSPLLKLGTSPYITYFTPVQIIVTHATPCAVICHNGTESACTVFGFLGFNDASIVLAVCLRLDFVFCQK